MSLIILLYQVLKKAYLNGIKLDKGVPKIVKKNIKYLIYVLSIIVIIFALKTISVKADIYISEYVRYTVSLAGIIFVTSISFNKNYIVNPKNAKDDIVRKFIEKHIKVLDVISRIIILTFSIAVIILAIIPAVLDLPYLIKGDFKTINCVTLSSANYGTLNERRPIQVKNVDTDEILYLEVKYTPIEIGEYYTIEYLPNLEIGKIVSKNK